MRPRTVAGAVLTVALVLVASPGIVGSLTPIEPSPPAAPAPRLLTLPVSSLPSVGSLDEAQRAKGAIGLEVQFLVPAGDAEALPSLAALVQPDAFAASETPPPTPKPTPKPTPRPTPRPTSASTGPYRQVLSGTATWYYGTTTAMRLPHGTKVRICGSSACIERTITDYGPAAWTGNLIDLMPADFRTVCGCGTGTGKVRVTVYVY